MQTSISSVYFLNWDADGVSCHSYTRYRVVFVSDVHSGNDLINEIILKTFNDNETIVLQGKHLKIIHEEC